MSMMKMMDYDSPLSGLRPPFPQRRERIVAGVILMEWDCNFAAIKALMFIRPGILAPLLGERCHEVTERGLCRECFNPLCLLYMDAPA